MDIKRLKESEFLLYDELISQSKSSFVFQTRPYLDCLKVIKQDYEIVGIFEDDFLVYALPVQKKKFPLINRCFYAIPYGIVTNKEVIAKSVINMFLNYLKKKALIIKLDLKERIDVQSFIYKEEITTIMLDLKKDSEDLFGEFSKTHRNCTRKAKKEGVVVSFEKSKKTIELFLDLYNQLIEVKKIDSISPVFLRAVINNLIDNDLGFFAVSRYNEVIHNMAFVSTINSQARYLYGASLRTEEKVPPIGQFSHYEIIKYLKQEGFLTYDLGGIPNLPVSVDDGAYNVYKFKKGFGGEPLILGYKYNYAKYKILKRLLH